MDTDGLHGEQRKLVLVSQVFHPDQQATGVLLAELFKRLSRAGRDCTVLAGFPARAPARVAVLSHEAWCGVRIVRGGLRVNSKKNMLLRGLAYVSYSAWLTWRLIFTVPTSSRVVVVTNPPFAPLIVWCCALLRGWKYDVLLHDLYPNGLVAIGRLRPRSLSVSIWVAANRSAFGAARRVVVLGRDMAAVCRHQYGVAEEKIRVIPNWSQVAPDAPRAAYETALWRRLGIASGSCVVQYSGNMGLWHDLDTIVRAAALLRDESAIRFLLIGDGLRRAPAERLAADLVATNVTWLPPQPAPELVDILMCAHISLLSQREGLAGVAVPSKLYGMLAVGRAVIAQAPSESEAAQVVAEERCGLVVRPGDAEGLAAAILQLARAPSEAVAMGRRARVAYEEKYTIEAAVLAFKKLWS